MKKAVAIALCIVMVLAVMVGCKEKTAQSTPSSQTTTQASTGTSDTTQTAKVQEYEDTINIAYTGDLNSADPYYTTSAAKYMNANMTFRTLTTYSYETGNIEGVLMTDWEYNEDHTEMIGHLRKGVKFHDGTDFTSEDVLFTWNFAKDVSNVKGPIFNADGMVKKIEAIDDYTVKFTFVDKMLDFQDYCQEVWIYSKDAWDTLPPEQAGIIGCGPYYFAGREPGVKWTLTRFDDYYEGIENYPTKNLVFKVITEESTRAAALESGEIDIDLSVDTSSVATLKANPNITVDIKEGLSASFVGFNFRKEFWQNKDARYAIAKAINKEDMVNIAYDGGVGGKVSNNLLAPDTNGYKEVNYIKYDPAGAKTLWDSLDGKKTSITLLTYPARKGIAEVVQANLMENLGIDVKLEIVESANFNALMNEKDFDIFINYIPCRGALMFQFNRYFADGGAQDQYGYDGTEYAKWLEYINAASDYEEMKVRFGELQQWLADECPLFPTVIFHLISAYRSDVKGFKSPGVNHLIDCSTAYIPKRG